MHPYRLRRATQIDHFNPASLRIGHRKATCELGALHAHGQAAIMGIPRRTAEKLAQRRLYSRSFPSIPIHADQQAGYVRTGGIQCKLLNQAGSGQRQHLNRSSGSNRRLTKPLVRADRFTPLIKQPVRLCQGHHAITVETLLIGRHDGASIKQGVGEMIVGTPFRSKLHPTALLKRNWNEAVAPPGKPHGQLGKVQRRYIAGLFLEPVHERRVYGGEGVVIDVHTHVTLLRQRAPDAPDNAWSFLFKSNDAAIRQGSDAAAAVIIGVPVDIGSCGFVEA